MPDPHDDFRDYNDALGETDYSAGEQPPEQNSPFSQQRYGFSNGDKTPSNNTLAKNGNLQKAWNRDNGGTTAPQINREGGTTAPKAGGNSHNPLNYKGSQNGAGGRFSRNNKVPLSAAAIKAKVKKRIIGGVLASALGLGGLGIGIAGPGLLLDKFANVMKTKFDTASQSLKRKASAFFKCALNASCRKNTKIAKLTTKVVQSLKNSGAKLKNAATGKEVIDPANPTEAPPTDNLEIETEKGTVTAENVETLSEKNPSLQGTLEEALPGANAETTAHGDGTAENVNNRDQVSKGSTDEDSKKPATDEQAKETRKKMTDAGIDDPDVVGQNDTSPQAKANTEMLDTVNNGSKVTPPVDKKASGGDDPNTSFDDAKAKAKSDADTQKDNVKAAFGESDPPSLKSAVESLAKGLIMQTLQVVCMGQQVMNAVNLAAKTIKLTAMVGFGLQFMKIVGEIRGAAATGAPGPKFEDVARLAGMLTTVMVASKAQTITDVNGDKQTVNKGDTVLPSAMDSFGYKFAAYGDTSLASATQNTFTFGTTGLSGALSVLGGVFTNSLPTVASWIGITMDKDAKQTLQEVQKNICGFVNGAVAGVASVAESLVETLGTGGIGALVKTGAKSGIKGVIKLITENAMKDGLKALLTNIGKFMLKQGLAFITIGWLTGKLTDFLTNAAVGKFMDVLPVGADAGDAATSGMGAYEGQLAQMGGNAPLTTSDAAVQLADQKTYLAGVRAVAQATDPWNIYDNNTAIGSITGNFIASLYANGNTPLGMAQSLLGMFGNSFATFAKSWSPAYADATGIQGYTNQCQDPDMNSVAPDMAIDPFCNQMYGLPSTSDLDISKVNADMGVLDYKDDGTIVGDGTYIDASGKAKGAYKTFLADCVNAGTPQGMEGSNADTCLISDTTHHGGHNQLFYNAVQYFRIADGINQGDEIGCQADGSCADSSSLSASPSASSTANSISNLCQEQQACGDDSYTDALGHTVLNQKGPSYFQLDYPDHNNILPSTLHPEGIATSIGDMGCGLVSVVNAAQALGTSSASVQDTTSWFNANHPDGSGYTYDDAGPASAGIAAHLGLTATSLGTSASISDINAVLNAGGMIQISGRNPNYAGQYSDGSWIPYSQGGHYIIISGVKDGKWAIMDSNGKYGGINSASLYAPSDLLSGTDGNVINSIYSYKKP